MEKADYLNHLMLPDTPAKPESPVQTMGVAIALVFLGVMVGFVAAKQLNRHDELAVRYREAAAGPFVETGTAARGGSERVIKELAETRPYAFATLYAKVSGYLDQVLVDKGDRVKKGQLLATIQSPETASQYDAAVADSRNKRIQASRMKQLHREMTVSDEDRDLAVAQADMAAAKATELNARKGYAVLVAPFDGVVTARFADPGALVQDAANASSGALPIVTVSQVERLRVTTFIDQRNAAFVQVGDPALITLAERPGVHYEARVTRKAGGLDTRSRTMLTEIELDNPRGEIAPGSFVDVALKIKTPQLIQIPSQGLIMRGTQAFALVVASDSTVHYRAIEVGDNDGTQVNVLSGLEEGETVALNVGNNLIEGQHVQPENSSKK